MTDVIVQSHNSSTANTNTSQFSGLSTHILYWETPSASATKVRIKSAVTVGGSYTLYKELDAHDTWGNPTILYEVPTGFYKVYEIVSAVEAELDAYLSEAIPTPGSQITTRMKRLLDDLSSPIEVSDTTLHNAWRDALTDFVSDDIGTDYSPLCIANLANTLSLIPVGVEETGIGTAMPGREVSLLAIGAMKELISGCVFTHSKYAISSDTPTGRINTTASPEQLRAYLGILEEKYERQLNRVLVANGTVLGAVVMDTADILTQRGYAEEI